MTKLLVATQNMHKLDEYRYMLQELGEMEWFIPARCGSRRYGS